MSAAECRYCFPYRKCWQHAEAGGGARLTGSDCARYLGALERYLDGHDDADDDLALRQLREALRRGCS